MHATLSTMLCLEIAGVSTLSTCSRPDSASTRASEVEPSPDGAPTRAAGAEPSPAYAAERAAMVDRQIADEGVSDPRVLDALRRVPRHLFVPPALEHAAYSDGPLPIPGGQTISQPYIVAFMTEAASISPSDRCLEIGTGSGYQAAILAELCAETFSIEYLPEVAAFGRRNLERAGYGERVALRVGDGYRGWPERAPFDVILVTAAPPEVPEPLLAQLAAGGKLVIPVGPEGGYQRLECWTRRASGSKGPAYSRDTLLGVQFVPFLGPGGE